MLRIAASLITIAMLCSAPSAHAKTLYTDNGEAAVAGGSNIEEEARRGLEEILDIWRDGRYEALYERTVRGKHSREAFISKLKSAARKPACCWEKMQDAEVTVKSGNSVSVKAKIGMEEAGRDTEFTTKAHKLVKEDGVWKISMSDILSLAGSSKKKVARVHHHKKKR